MLKHFMIVVLISLDLRVIHIKISGVIYHFVVRFPIGHVYDEVKDKHILLNSLNYTSLGSLFHFKREDVFDRHYIIIFLKKMYEFYIRSSVYMGV